MNNDIKEILEEPKILMLSYGNYVLLDDYVKLKNYITNSQEENKHLDEVNCKLRKNIEKLKNTNKNLKEELTLMVKDDEESQKAIIKQAKKIDKAIKYINNKWKKEHYYEDIENCMTFCKYDKNKLINILEGSEIE